MNTVRGEDQRTKAHAGLKFKPERQRPRLFVARRAQPPVPPDAVDLPSDGFPVAESFACARTLARLFAAHALDERVELFCVRVSLVTAQSRFMTKVGREMAHVLAETAGVEGSR